MTDHIYAGIDLGGTKILVLIADDNGKVIGDTRIPTEAALGVDGVINRIVEATKDAVQEAGVELPAVRAIGVSAPGPIDTVKGIITDPPNLHGWHNVPLARILQERLDAPAILENDANCQGLAEHEYGAGRGFRHMVFVTASTGIGGGIIIDNELYVGASGAAGEIGHLVVASEGPTCGAGHIGCLEAMASGTAIARDAAALIAQGQLVRTARIAEHNPPLDAADVFRASQEGETEAGALITRAGRYLGTGLASIINAFNPQAIIIGGGLINMGDAIMAPAIEVARDRSFGQSFNDVQIIESELGDRAGALGAIAVARKKVAAGAM